MATINKSTKVSAFSKILSKILVNLNAANTYIGTKNKCKKLKKYLRKLEILNENRELLFYVHSFILQSINMLIICGHKLLLKVSHK